MKSRIAITGANGFVGTELRNSLMDSTYEVIRFVRSKEPTLASSAYWNPCTNEIDLDALENCSALFHFAGENIATRRWTAQQKMLIRSSRISGSRLLIDSIARLKQPPAVIVIASAIGYYGNRHAEILNEDSGPGDSFLSSVCKEIEELWLNSKITNSRIVLARIGVVLHPSGGALAKMLLPFKLGLGGPLGHGTQWLSWISLEDTISAFRYILEQESIEGPINLVSPNPIRNLDFTKSLAGQLNRPSFFRAPKWALRLALGELANETLLSSSKVLPKKLMESGFKFKHPSLGTALSAMIQKP
jgi:hypothetical protein